MDMLAPIKGIHEEMKKLKRSNKRRRQADSNGRYVMKRPCRHAGVYSMCDRPAAASLDMFDLVFFHCSRIWVFFAIIQLGTVITTG